MWDPGIYLGYGLYLGLMASFKDSYPFSVAWSREWVRIEIYLLDLVKEIQYDH